MPSPMTLMFQKIPVSLCCYFTSLRFNPYAQAPEWGGDEEQHQVIATVETATFVVAALGSNLDQRSPHHVILAVLVDLVHALCPPP